MEKQPARAAEASAAMGRVERRRSSLCRWVFEGVSRKSSTFGWVETQRDAETAEEEPSVSGVYGL